MNRRILTIDGGGIKGVFPASFLSCLEDEIEGNIFEYFDLIVGTSTGGIIALGLSMGMTASEVLEFYEEYGAKIFLSDLHGKPVRKWFSRKFRSTYDNNNLQIVLKNKFNDKRIGHSKVRLVIPTLNAEKVDVHLFKTAHHERFKLDYKRKVVDVAMATSAAPTYFPAYAIDEGLSLIDGGIWANNPLSVAVNESIAVLGWNPTNIKILSLGCTTEVLNVKSHIKKAKGELYWANNAVDIFMGAQSSFAISQAKLFIGKENLFRISPVVAKGRFELDGINDIQSLKGLGYNEARENLGTIKDIFFSEKVEEFIPIYKLL